MALDYRKCAEEIFSHLGGRDNIISAAHCATRLRLVIADNSKIDKEALENVEGVKGLFDSNGQLQLIIGTGTVNKVYDEFLAVTGMTAATKDEVKQAAASKMPLWKKILKTPGDVFVPILPAIVASGLMMGIVEAIPKFAPAFGQTDWFSFLDLVANTAFALLPVLVAISAARVFGGNIFLGAVIGLMMVHPALINAWTVSSYVGEIPTWSIFFYPIQQVGYQGHVIPVILAVLLMSTIEKWLHKHVPEMIDLFVTPLVTVVCTAYLTFTVIGPVFSVFENWVLAGAQALITVGFGLGAAVMGAIYPLTVVMGLHHMYNVIEAGMISSTGVNTWMPIATAANIAQFGACLAVALKCRNQKTKSVALPSSLSASLGITEPAIFGINFRFMKPFIAGMIGGAVGSLFASWMTGTDMNGNVVKFGATTYGVTGIPGIPAINNIPMYLLLMLISAGVAFAITWFIWNEDEPKKQTANGAPAAKTEAKAPAASVIRCAAGELIQPTPGKVIARENIPDATFADGILGDGVGIEPSEGVVYAPFDGEVTSVFDTKHAITLEKNGMEVLIHVGVNTVNMNGEGFEAFVKEGDTVKAGQKLLTFDSAKIKAAGYSDCVVVLLTNAEELEKVECGIK
ncbi:MAG: PTS glucose transporter subunit IIA [Oscillospiraceae bacterium]|nr:PTS glucose transporter subunit IIA [Oscillospiraceae bacterium]